jgi:hypothetical protein
MPDNSRSNETKFIPFNALAGHLEEQVRGKTNAATVNNYSRGMRNGEIFPPLTVADVGGSLILVDGFHRRAAYQQNGEWQAVCEIIPCESLEQALWLAFNANMRHGLPLKSKAKREAFRAYVKAGNHELKDGGFQSYRDIAGAIPGSTHVTIWRWTQQDFPELFVAMSGGGDEAEGGLRPSHKYFLDPPVDLTNKALELLDDVQALMDGVGIPELRKQVADRANMLAISLEIWGAGTVNKKNEERNF